MKSNEILFNEDFEMTFFSKKLNKEIILYLADYLDSTEEDLSDEYKMKIATFINEIDVWYPIAKNAIKERANNKYNVVAKDNDIQLMSIFVLFEQSEDELYGLSFRVSFDIEHGCGLKMNKNNYKITEIGLGEVSFS